MKRALLAAALCAALALPAPALAFKTGSYSGTNSQAYDVAFRVVKQVTPRRHKKPLTTYYVRLSGAFTTTKVTCPDGYSVEFSLTTNPPLRAKVSSKGKFSFTLPRGGYPLKFSGKLTGSGKNSKATGKLSNVLNGETHGATCTSGALTWTAQHD